MPSVQVKKPKAIVFDIMGTITKSGLIEKVLMPFIKENVRKYLNDSWDKADLQKDIDRLRKQMVKEGAADHKVPLIKDKDSSPEEIKESVAQNVEYYMEHGMDTKAHQIFRFNMWFAGFLSGLLKTHVYSDVALQMKKWKMEEGIKLYTFSNMWVDAQKVVLTHTNHGDLGSLISGYYDTSTIGSPRETSSYSKLVEKIGVPAEDIVFLTKSTEAERAASPSGIVVVLVLTHRHNVAALEQEAGGAKYVRSFHEIEFTEG